LREPFAGFVISAASVRDTVEASSTATSATTKGAHMASHSEADRILREHGVLKDQTAELQNEHADLESKPFHAAEHRDHKRKLAAHQSKLRDHADRLKANKP
jgi:hypothetical protein